MSVSFTIHGILYSMKNRRVPSRHNPRVTHVNSDCRAFERDFFTQLPRRCLVSLGSLAKPLKATVTVYYPSMRHDVDAEWLFDLCQKAGVVRNDRYIREKHIVGRIDKVSPRVEVVIEEMR